MIATFSEKNINFWFRLFLIQKSLKYVTQYYILLIVCLAFLVVVKDRPANFVYKYIIILAVGFEFGQLFSIWEDAKQNFL